MVAKPIRVLVALDVIDASYMDALTDATALANALHRRAITIPWQPGDAPPSTTRTAAGIELGSSEAEIAAAYGPARVAPHPYLEDGGHLVIVEGKRPGSALVFETAAGRVTGFRAGRHPAVDYSEGCQ